MRLSLVTSQSDGITVLLPPLIEPAVGGCGRVKVYEGRNLCCG
ncbi:hypothetical protein HanIR_Chr02g0068581 [Helianthus annuus]|nr:hypothetical protein HanIR_Chr02g0068581 [Helianthus annuus]